MYIFLIEMNERCSYYMLACLLCSRAWSVFNLTGKCSLQFPKMYWAIEINM